MAEESPELPLLALLAWEERWQRWRAVPQERRQLPVRELARAMVRLADAESRHEHDEDRSPASWRLAVGCVRQPAPGQVRSHPEPAARQHPLAERARESGWPGNRIRTIDADLGHSAGEHAKGARSGFDEPVRLLARNGVGGVFGTGISRLARNTVEWFQLPGLCRMHDVAIVEDSQGCMPNRDDDSLIPGIRGTMPASGLSVLRARMEGGRRNRALRGALYWRVAAGFVREGDTIRKDPDQRVQASVAAVFAAFREAGTARQAAARLRDRDIGLPVRDHSSGEVLWRPASCSRTLRIPGNPAMGGACAYGLRRGRRRDTPPLPVEERWEVLLPERHEGYAGWQEWLGIQEQLASGHSCRDGSRRGPAREGPALLQGLVVCGHCGYGMAVRYSARGWSYGCETVDPASHRKRGCCPMGGKRLDREVARLFLEMATPAGVGAAVQAAADVAGRAEADLRRWEQALEHCRYQAGLAERRYRQAGPTAGWSRQPSNGSGKRRWWRFRKRSGRWWRRAPNSRRHRRRKSSPDPAHRSGGYGTGRRHRTPAASGCSAALWSR